MKQKYHNKRPFQTLHPNAQHWTRKGNSWKVKVAYESEDEAEEFLRLNPKLIAQGYKSYICPICSKWHVGHQNNKL